MTDCDHEWEPLEFEDGEKSKAQVCSRCGALKSGQGSIVITADYIDFSPLTLNPTLAEGRQWFRSDFDAMYWSPDGSVIERMETVPPPIASGSLTGIKGFEYLVEGDPTDSWLFTMNPSAGVWIKQYSTGASFNAQMVYHGAYQHWRGDNTFVDVPNKADNVYGAGEEATVHQVPDGAEISSFSPTAADLRDVTWDGEYLWMADNDAGGLYKYTKGGTKKGFLDLGFGANRITGSCWDAQYLWVALSVASWLYQYTTGGSEVTRVDVSADVNVSDSVAWDGEYLWVTDHNSNGIYQFLPDGTRKGFLAGPGPRAQGVAWDGEYLWVSDFAANATYQLTRGGTEKGSFAIPGVNNYGTTWDGQYLWNTDYGSTSVYQIGNAGSFDLDYKIVPA